MASFFASFQRRRRRRCRDVAFGVILNRPIKTNSKSSKFGEQNKEIEKLLNNKWKIERISAVDKAILFAGIIELNLDNNLTNNVIISEYIEIAEQMGGEAKFINKLLDKISKTKILNLN